MNIVALIPARSGSKRIPDKNIKLLGGVPLMCWTISVARKSRIFSDVIVSTDAKHYAQTADAWDATVVMRPPEISTDTSTDPEWVFQVLPQIKPKPDAFALLRPTAPFRTVETLRRALSAFILSEADSIRALQRAKEHPYKMWVVRDDRAFPLFPLWDLRIQQTNSMPIVYWQNASLEMCWTKAAEDTETITGHTIAPFFTKWLEGFDINRPEQWAQAEAIVKSGKVEVPK